jgi:hypothetical protein
MARGIADDLDAGRFGSCTTSTRLGLWRGGCGSVPERSRRVNAIEETVGAWPSVRATLRSTGVHLGALRLLGRDDYSRAEYIEAVTLAEEVGIGEAYATACLGPDVDALLRGVADEGEEVVRAAESRLRRSGVDPAQASYAQYADALIAVSR